MTYRLISISLICLFPLMLLSQATIEKGLQYINEQDARTHIGILASDSLGGRKHGQPGGLMAAEYIKNTLSNSGTTPYKGEYYQPFNFHRDLDSKTRMFSLSSIKAQSDTATFFPSMDMRNVLGYIEGEKTDEIIIIGAHYDHLGTDIKLKGDNIYNGADDNASGVSAVLQIARAFSQLDEKPKRSIIFAFFDGEERGLLGSGRFLNKYKKDSTIHQIKGFINCDMIGRGKNKQVTYFSSDNNPVFKEWLENDIDRYSLDLKPNFRHLSKLRGLSDHTTFVRQNIPIIFYHTDIHSDYHKPSDHADKIDYDKVVEITKAAFLSLWNMVNEKDF